MGCVLINSFWILIWVLISGYGHCQRTEVVNIGAIFTYNSVIGSVAKLAIETAVDDVNADPSILNGTQLKLIMEDVDCNVFLGSVKAFEVLEKEVVAIIGPLSSSVAHMISMIVNSFQVPLLSFAATDSSLSSLQFPFFLRTTQTDSYQMAAMAELINYYRWRNIIAIFVDNDYGRNGISVLEEELGKRMSKISYNIPLPVQFNLSSVADFLNKSKVVGSSVYVVHANPNSGLAIFSIAQHLEMMTKNYVWLATEWLSTTLDSLPIINGTLLHILQGVVGFRQHTPESSHKNAFLSRWKEFQKRGLVRSELITYGLNAYDSVWAVARSVDEFLNEHGNVTFSHKKVGNLPQEYKTFDGGTFLLEKLLRLNFTGLTGNVRFDVNRNIVGGGFEVININGAEVQRIGYWTNYSGFLVVPPETLNREQERLPPVDQKLKNVTWPGGNMDKPRGWHVAKKENPLRIGVPNRVSFIEYVTEQKSSHKIQGYCVDVFYAAIELLLYEVSYTLNAFGNGVSNPSYNELVKMVDENVFDAAVGDISITTNRTKIVDFAQPFFASSLVILAPVRNNKSSAWIILQPFTVEMWCVTVASFVLLGVVTWILEHRQNDDFRGPPRRQLTTIFLFGFSTMFKANKEQIVSALGRLVIIVWPFALMVIKASYTASLASILTVKQLSSPITGIEDLIASNWPIGYQVGSFVPGYLSEKFHIARSRLVSLSTPEEYERALRQGPLNGGVLAIIDERPYVDLFLSNQTDFGIVGQSLAKNGWGFAFQKNSPLAIDMSTAILSLSESGELQKIYEKWFCRTHFFVDKRQQSESNQLPLSTFEGLFLFCASFVLIAILIFFLRTVHQFVRCKRRQMDPSSSSTTSSESFSTRCSQVMRNYFSFIDKREDTIKQMFQHNRHPESQASSSGV